MAKLNKTNAKKVAEAESNFTPIPDGVYHVRLRNVDASKSGPAGPYWSWEFEVVEEENTGRRLWTNTSLSENALWKLKESFDAFGVDTDTDTDDLCGQICKAVVSTRTIQQGDRKGEQTNQIERLVPGDEGFTPTEPVASDEGDSGDGETAGVGAGEKSDDIF